MVKTIFKWAARERFFTFFAVLVACNAISAWFIHQQLRHRLYNQTQQRLLSMVSTIGLTIDAETHEKLTARDQMNSIEYRDLSNQLSQILRQEPSIKYIYTIREADHSYRFIVDPTPEGDADQDGVQDKSFLMEPYSEITSTAKTVLRSGRPEVEPVFYEDRWGSFMSAYAPILARNGKVVGIVGIDLPSETYQSWVSETDRTTLRAFLLGLMVALAASLAISRFAVPKRSLPTAATVKEEMGKIRALYMLLTVLVVGTLGSAGLNLVSQNDSASLRLSLIVTLEKIESARRTLYQALADQAITPERIDDLNSIFRQHDLPAEVRPDSNSEEDLRAAASSAIVALDAHTQSTIDQISVEEAKFQDHSIVDQTAAIVSILLSLATLVVIRTTIVQSRSLREANEEFSKVEESRRQLVESLPVGFFWYSNGEFRSSNWAFDAQIGRDSNEPISLALERALSDFDKRLLYGELSATWQNPHEFKVKFRMDSTGGASDAQWFELNGLPIFERSGQLKHLACFTVNITELVGLNDQLEDRNRAILESKQDLQAAYDDLEKNFVETVYSLVKAVEAKDPYTAGHSERVKQYSTLIARSLDVSQDDLRILELGCLIHDVGKIGIPDDLLTKPSRLTDEEYKQIQAHPEVGENMLRNIPTFKNCLPIVRWHHERLDGSGYPDGLKGDEISLLVRICAVADSFDAMTSTRAYRKGLSVDHAISELRKDASAGKLDQKIVEQFADIIYMGGIGDLVSERVA